MNDEDKKEIVKQIIIICTCIIFYFIVKRIGIILGVLKEFLEITSAIIIGMFIAYMLIPIVNKCKEKLKCGTRAAIVITYTSLIAIIVGVICVALPQIYNSITELSSKIPYAYDLVHKYIRVDLDEVDIKNKIKSTLITKKQITNYIIPMAYGFGKGVTNIILSICVAITVSVYTIIDKDNINRKIRLVLVGIVKEDKANKIFIKLKEYCNVFRKFIVGKIIDSVIIGIITFIVISLTGIGYGALSATIVGIFNIIPYFGPFIGAIPCILLYLSNSLKSAIIFTVMIIIIQQFDGMYLGPKILGHKLGVTPLLILVSITIGGYYLGVVGMIVGVPIAIIICDICNEIMERGVKRNEG